MIRTILVPAPGTEIDTTGYTAAMAVARSFGAHIDALHVRLDPVEVAVAMSTEGAGGTLLEGIINSMTRDADEREGRARSRLAKFLLREGLPLSGAPVGADAKPTAQFHVETGEETRWMATYALTADLAVVSRGAAGANATARSTLTRNGATLADPRSYRAGAGFRRAGVDRLESDATGCPRGRQRNTIPGAR
jgi:hypothetical protein